MRGTAVRAVKVAISAVVLAVDSVVGAVAPARRRGRRSTGVVLMYHDVAPDDRAAFAAQCDLVARLGVPTPAAEMGLPADGSWRVAWTFDDAFRSFAEEAVPEMEARAIPSTLFVPTEWSQRADDPDATFPGLSPERLAALPPSVEVASHSRSHPRLPQLDDAALAEELAGSRAELEAIVGRPVTTHAFPYGEHDSRVDAAARAAGYERCYGIVPTLATDADDFVVGRVQVDPWDWPIEVRLKALGAYRWMAWWMHARRGPASGR
jgi:peptidoglycan/xylan/chitin deacetylase (PgdA/CDA1 family)